ncbi:hypothetical protein CYY_005419 [Polysphondylium violaceum]|uniref:CS domain-containing protein n=1 Tax=Polysphondylium violaceum TaxID=133409 RepID=A0A8J4PTS9_9MYCE|nr:hypothetical protein CYY_005419 [Polysphondylium violaceum]
MSIKPNVEWAERADHLYITIACILKEDTKPEIKIEATKFSFKGVSNENKNYEVEIELYKEIVVEESNFTTNSRYPKILLKKKESGYWNFLVKNKAKLPYVKIDWNNWKDEDDVKETDEEPQGFDNFDMSKMMGMGGMGGMPGMPGMGGMGGMGGMPGMDDMNWDEEDGEDLPDLKDDDEEEEKMNTEEAKLNTID